MSAYDLAEGDKDQFDTIVNKAAVDCQPANWESTSHGDDTDAEKKHPARLAQPTSSTAIASLQFALDGVATEDFPSFVKRHESTLTFPEKVMGPTARGKCANPLHSSSLPLSY
jgi:hypothetical protein